MFGHQQLKQGWEEITGKGIIVSVNLDTQSTYYKVTNHNKYNQLESLHTRLSLILIQV